MFRGLAVVPSMKPIQMPLPRTRLSNSEYPAILLFRDSHSQAVHLAVEKRLRDGHAVPIAVFRQLKEKNGRKVGNITFDGFLNRISQLRREDVVLSMMGGTATQFWHHTASATV